MTNAPLELARLFKTLREPQGNATWNARLTHLGEESNTDALGAMRLLAEMVTETEKCIDDLGATGHRVDPFRDAFPVWAKAAFRTSANPGAGMNSSNVINDHALGLLEALGNNYANMPISIGGDDRSHLQEALAQAYELVRDLPLNNTMQELFASKFIRVRKLLDAPSPNQMRIIESLCELIGLMTLAIETLPVDEDEKQEYRSRGWESWRFFFRDFTVSTASGGFILAAEKILLGS